MTTFVHLCTRKHLTAVQVGQNREDLSNFECKSKGSRYGVNHLPMEAWIKKLSVFMCKSVGLTFHSFVITAMNSASGTLKRT
jgi:hypothetical protein